MAQIETKNFWAQLNNLVLIRFLLLFACGWAAIRLLEYFEAVIVIFTFAAIVAFLLSYPVRWLTRFLPRGLAVSVVFLLSLIVIAAIALTLGLTVLSQAQQLADSIGAFLKSVTPLVQKIELYLRSRNLQVNLSAVQESLSTQAVAGVVSSLAIFQAIFTNFVYFILIAVVSCFMLLDGERLWDLMLKIVPLNLRKRFSATIRRKFLGFFRGQLILTLFLFALTFVAFLILQVPFALLLAVIAGLFDLIPGIGATLAVAIIFSIVLSQNVWLAFKVLAICIIIQQIQDNLIAPRVMQNALNLNPVVVFFALLVGAKVAGLLGVFISIPTAGVIVSMLEIDEMKGDT
jgi:predicted PurR-regulated permease PerM